MTFYKRALFLYVFFLFFSLTAEELRLSADCEPIVTIADSVNVLSGHFFQIDKDIEDESCDPLHLTLFYDSGQKTGSYFGIGFGCQFALCAAPPSGELAFIEERDGFYLPYIAKRNSYQY